MNTEKVKQLPTLLSLLEDLPTVAMLHVEVQQLLIVTMTVHYDSALRQQLYHTNQDSLVRAFVIRLM